MVENEEEIFFGEYHQNDLGESADLNMHQSGKRGARDVRSPEFKEELVLLRSHFRPAESRLIITVLVTTKNKTEGIKRTAEE